MNTTSLTRYIAFVLGIAFLTFSCKKDRPIIEEPTDPTIVEDIAQHLQFFDEPTEADERVHLINEPIILKDTSLDRSECQSYAAWAHVAEVVTLKHAGTKLSTTHVAIAGDLALVSYHQRGDVHYGALEVIDLKNPNNPKIKSQAFFVNADVNAIAVEANPAGNETRVWVALSDKTNGAVLGELILKNKKFKKNNYRQVKLTYKLAGAVSSSANYIAEAGDYLYVTSGRSNGGVFCLNKDALTLVGLKQFTNGKGVAVNGSVANSSTVAAIQSYTNPQIMTDLVGHAGFASSFAIGPVTHKNVGDELGGKISVAFAATDSPYLMMTSGKNGVIGYDVTTGETVFTSPEKMLGSGNSNGISIDDRFMYVANGADGLAIFPMAENGLPDGTSTFLWDMNEPEASANFVASNGSWLFVAKGEGGFKILKTPNPGDCLPSCSSNGQGVPDCLMNDDAPCATIQQKIAAALPLEQEAEDLHPEYFTGGASEILLQEETQIEVVFIEENTNLKNQMGYYFYDAECPPESPDELIALLLFQNFSADGSGGGLVQGNRMSLPGNFKAGTKIGFFLIRNGWNGGHQIFFTNPAFNNNNNKRGLLMYDADCNTLVGAMQANALPSFDADFRDMVFEIKFTTEGAYDPHDFIQL